MHWLAQSTRCLFNVAADRDQLGNLSYEVYVIDELVIRKYNILMLLQLNNGFDRFTNLF
jgi:hypothetical protein